MLLDRLFVIYRDSVDDSMSGPPVPLAVLEVRRPEGGLCAHLAGARRARLAARGGDARGGRAAPDADDAAAGHEGRVEEARARDPESMDHAWESEGGSLEERHRPARRKGAAPKLARAFLHAHVHLPACHPHVLWIRGLEAL